MLSLRAQRGNLAPHGDDAGMQRDCHVAALLAMTKGVTLAMTDGCWARNLFYHSTKNGLL